MAKFLNNTIRVISVANNVLIPGVEAELKLRQKDLELYPSIQAMIKKGDLIVEGLEVEAVDLADKENLDFDDMTVAELKAYAHAHQIDLGDAIKKAEIIAVLKG